VALRLYQVRPNPYVFNFLNPPALSMSSRTDFRRCTTLTFEEFTRSIIYPSIAL